MTSKRQFRDSGQRQKALSEANLGHLNSGRHNPWVTIAAVMGAAATLVASLVGMAVGIDSTYKATAQSKAATNQAQAATNQAKEAQEAQVSERFSRSVEQLGSRTMTVRVGAVYSFGRLIRDSNIDQRIIDEVLCNFVLLQAVAAHSPAVPESQKRHRPPSDLLAALSVLDGQYAPNAGFLLAPTAVGWHPMNLKDVDLSSFDLANVAMRGVDLTGANLTGADLTDANLTGADLTGADLTGTDLTRLNLAQVVLNSANLSGVDLTSVNLTGATVDYANCSPATQWPTQLASRPHCRRP